MTFIKRLLSGASEDDDPEYENALAEEMRRRPPDDRTLLQKSRDGATVSLEGLRSREANLVTHIEKLTRELGETRLCIKGVLALSEILDEEPHIPRLLTDEPAKNA